MPGFNQTGPMGKGSMTGRKVGLCTNFGANINKQVSATSDETDNNFPPGFQGRRYGGGFGKGRNRDRGITGLGFGRRNRFRNST